MEFAVILIVFLVTAVLLLAPLRDAATGGDSSVLETGEVLELEARKEAIYRQLSELELDFRAGKLSESDFRGLDASLRAEALSLMEQIERFSSRKAK